jgi:hypothetical protein
MNKLLTLGVIITAVAISASSSAAAHAKPVTRNGWVASVPQVVQEGKPLRYQVAWKKGKRLQKAKCNLRQGVILKRGQHTLRCHVVKLKKTWKISVRGIRGGTGGSSTGPSDSGGESNEGEDTTGEGGEATDLVTSPNPSEEVDEDGAHTGDGIDTDPPIFTSATSFTLYSSTLLTTQNIRVQALDKGAVVPVLCDHQPPFQAGATYYITCTAHDRAGNQATQLVTLVVRDNGKPVLNMPASTVIKHNQSPPVPTANDAVDGVRGVTCSPMLHAIPTGENTVTCTAEDKAGNKTVSSFKVSKLPAPAPVIDMALPQYLGQDVRFPKPNDDAGWRMLGVPSGIQRQTEGNTYKYVTAGWEVKGRVVTGKVKEDILVKTRQGTKTWSWSLFAGDGQNPVLHSDGSVTWGQGMRIDKPLITDTSGKALAITQPRWALTGNTLSLTINDSAYPLPYVIDPPTGYPSVSITTGPANGSFIQSGWRSFSFTYTEGPAISIKCRLVRERLTEGSHVIWNDVNTPCNPLSTGGITPILMHGQYTLDIVVHNGVGVSYARSVFTVDQSAPSGFAFETSGGQTLPMNMVGALPACASVPTQRGPEFGVHFSTRPQDAESGIDRYTVSVDGIDYPDLPGDVFGYAHPDPLSSGSHVMRFRAFNRSGLFTEGVYNFRVDNDFPSVPVVTSPPTASIPRYAFGSPVHFAFSAVDDNCLRHYSIVILSSKAGEPSVSPQPHVKGVTGSENTWIVSGSNNGLTINGLPKGLYTWTLRATDSAPRTTQAQHPITPGSWFTFQVS